ncbi:hypothetical protein [Ruminococcus albus]|uniref:Uncharacterized protein n=1 Tax=Ruminococcus albus TaxID=1264 RepID=A0A1H7EY59_RUMAL|nr:hypothetical protein [Ruminococcus albus]SEK18816.1 hypothetical protein SAMN05216469_1017 [Ruminococcus albus]
MANLKEEYTQHIQDTAPDMDKLWNRISDEIDKKETETKSETTYTENREQIKRSGGYMKIAAVAAAFIVVFAGVNIMNESKKTKAAMDKIPLSRPDRTEETASENKNDEKATTTTGSDNKTGIKAEDDQTDGVFPIDGHASMTDEAPEAVKTTVKYNQLRFNSTDTVSYVADYVAKGDEYFVEDKVFKSTDCFADVTVVEADLSSEGATYVLQVNSMYDKDGELIVSEIVLNSSTPYILQENREYLLPLKRTGADSYSIVFENAPQIEITIDGGAVFQNGWTALSGGAEDLEKDSLNVNDFYFDRMKYTPSLDLESFLDQWNNA